MNSENYGYPHIPLSKLRELKKAAETLFYLYHYNDYDLWLLLIREEINRRIIEELNNKLRNARNYRGVEGYACPLCEYENGVFVRNCEMHQKIEDQAEEIEKLRAIVDVYENAI